jgi:ABC-type dipeptide/oligopeptide/nickel transport system permease component
VNAPALRDALKRLLGLIPTLLVVSMMAFWGLSRALHSSASNDEATLPLFFNRAPIDVTERARLLATALARSSASLDTIAEQPEAQQLTRLGGAALPGLMPFLDSLPPQQRARVALALAPLAGRMGIADPEDFESPERATAFWSRYWLDRSIDFRPQVVERAIRRLAQRSSALRRTEVNQLDTYALPGLMQALESEDEPATVAQLLSVVSHITEGACSSAANDSLSRLWTRSDECLRWWSENQHTYAQLDGNRRLVAMLQETQYGKWVLKLMRGELTSASSSAHTSWSLLPTLVLIGGAIVGGYFVGPLLAAWAATLTRRRYWLLSASFVLAILPAAAVASWLSRGLLASKVAALVAMILLGASALGIHQYQATRDACSFEFVRMRRAFGVTRLRAALHALHSSSVASAAQLANHGASLLTAACIVEWAFDWHGLGWLTVQAVHAGDVSTLVLVAVVGTFFTGALQIASSLILSRFERSSRGFT